MIGNIRRKKQRSSGPAGRVKEKSLKEAKWDWLAYPVTIIAGLALAQLVKLTDIWQDLNSHMAASDVPQGSFVISVMSRRNFAMPLVAEDARGLESRFSTV